MAIISRDWPSVAHQYKLTEQDLNAWWCIPYAIIGSGNGCSIVRQFPKALLILSRLGKIYFQTIRAMYETVAYHQDMITNRSMDEWLQKKNIFPIYMVLCIWNSLTQTHTETHISISGHSGWDLTMWRHKIWSTSVQVMTCHVASPNHYLNQCWLNNVTSFVVTRPQGVFCDIQWV